MSTLIIKHYGDGVGVFEADKPDDPLFVVVQQSSASGHDLNRVVAAYNKTVPRSPALAAVPPAVPSKAAQELARRLAPVMTQPDDTVNDDRVLEIDPKMQQLLRDQQRKAGRSELEQTVTGSIMRINYLLDGDVDTIRVLGKLVNMGDGGKALEPASSARLTKQDVLELAKYFGG